MPLLLLLSQLFLFFCIYAIRILIFDIIVAINVTTRRIRGRRRRCLSNTMVSTAASF